MDGWMDGLDCEDRELMSWYNVKAGCGVTSYPRGDRGVTSTKAFHHYYSPDIYPFLSKSAAFRLDTLSATQPHPLP
ncbi:hypothetical protein PoB_005273900 [Plakobranchus ocellatus]|uniref:Uncharacterized protein n=1 Tax=Plakobranchus ocellatus TaxID=259542 RepID=A0AAV4C6C9_9GAST|nr:hypothetical protein PoB_005273900 [Plakobranchus ocellatus]